MIVIWKIGVKPLLELCTHFTEAKFHLFCGEISANGISHNAKQTFHIISCACPGIFSIVSSCWNIASSPLPSMLYRTATRVSLEKPRMLFIGLENGENQ